jgi:hypothetical protein
MAPTTTESNQGLYASPRAIENLADCYFYHSTDIPGHGFVRGEWDLRPGIDAYLGHFDFRGRRVLDIGAASGFLSFHMEKCGADVVSYDLSEKWAWDIVPFSGAPDAAIDAERRAHMRRINNGYWFCHQAFLLAGEGCLRNRLRNPGGDRSGGRCRLWQHLAASS